MAKVCFAPAGSNIHKEWEEANQRFIKALSDVFGAENVKYKTFDFDTALGVSVQKDEKAHAISVPLRYDDTPLEDIKYKRKFILFENVYDYMDDYAGKIFKPRWEKYRITPYNWKAWILTTEDIEDIINKFKEIFDCKTPMK